MFARVIHRQGDVGRLSAEMFVGRLGCSLGSIHQRIQYSIRTEYPSTHTIQHLHNTNMCNTASGTNACAQRSAPHNIYTLVLH